MKAEPKREGPLKIPMKFDDAIKRALTVRPPKGGWAKYEARLKKNRSKVRKSKSRTA